MSRISRFPKIAWTNLGAVAAVAIAIALIAVKNLQADVSNQILNVSYDPTRELYRSLNEQFTAKYERDAGKQLRIKQSHGDSSRQAWSVLSGEQPADVVTLGLFSDIDAPRKRGLIAAGRSSRLPHNSQPYSSTIVFVVRKNNPRQIRDWA
jgi:ABC-type sulfate transport system substrate-binding protein